MHVLLFDIDGTLIRSGGAGGDALRAAFCELFSVETPADVPFSGRTDRGIVSQMLAKHSLPSVNEQAWSQLQERYLEWLAHYLPLKQGGVLQGVESVLPQLAGRDDIALGLLTGNSQQGARVKLEYFELYHYFGFGGFGDRHTHRNDVAREALQAANDNVPQLSDQDDIWVIGDTPLDIECGRAINAKVIAVTTGFHDTAELEAASPDFLVDRLDESPLMEL